MPLVHHELCFGCGRTNLFGLLLEAEQVGPGRVSARGFVKQDHQGPERGFAHEGIVATALSEAMSLACGNGSRARRVEIDLIAPVAVGTFLELVADCDSEGAAASATALAGGVLVARATGTYDR